MTTPGRTRRVSRNERIARAAIGMPAHHPELVTRQPGGRVEAARRLVRAAVAHDEYTAIVTDAWRQDQQ